MDCNQQLTYASAAYGHRAWAVLLLSISADEARRGDASRRALHKVNLCIGLH